MSPALNIRTRVDSALARATAIPEEKIRAHVNAVRAKNPHASPDEIITILSKQFTAFLQSTGGAVGATAAFPGIGTTTALVLSAADLAVFLSAASIYSLAVAEVHEVRSDDPERRKALVLSSVLGESGAQSLTGVTAKPVTQWGTTIMTSLPKSTIKQVNSVLSSRFAKRYFVKHAGATVGRMIPFGIGAVVGIAGGRALAHTVVHQTTKAFGPAPIEFATPVFAITKNGEEDAASFDHLIESAH
ncbi:hypothetical protein [Timonella sp. A28]|uniref:hypothetical protein n=1 Tax=Timonella sp. A28 TaxID=3442640 RepID=UPI003EC0175A